ncbi:unnamed protein product [Arctogadus glacialis]
MLWRRSTLAWFDLPLNPRERDGAGSRSSAVDEVSQEGCYDTLKPRRAGEMCAAEKPGRTRALARWCGVRTTSARPAFVIR